MGSPDFAAAHDAARRAGQFTKTLAWALGVTEQAVRDARQAHLGLVQDAAREQIDRMDIDSLREVTSATSLYLAPLRAAGISTVGQVQRTPDAVLRRLPGMGTTRIRAIRTATQAVWEAAVAAQPVMLDPAAHTPFTSRLVCALATTLHSREAAVAVGRWQDDRQPELADLLAQTTPARSRIRWLFSSSQRRLAATTAGRRLLELIGDGTRLAAAFEQISASSRISIAQAWQLFERDAAQFYAELERLTGAGAPGAAVTGGLAAAIVTRVERQPLDLSLLRGSLRAYQDFGARFILAQRRVILGDEMGLGKTFQVIAAMTHLAAAEDATHFVVVCPASVTINWQREILQHSLLIPYLAHGEQRDQVLHDWASSSRSVLITTYETLRSLDWPPVQASMVTIDEAHYIKNPATKRTQACARLISASPYVALLSGTPMENRVDEFVELIRLVQPELLSSLDRPRLRLGPRAFRRAVAAVYLRRSQSDVLMELPERIDTDDWVHLGSDEMHAYRAAVEAGNWMAMRQAGFRGRSPEKLERLLDLCAEAGANGRKVVVFSYFLDVLERVCRELGPLAAGPITGAVPARRRQEVLDEFSSTDHLQVLVAQIQVGGIGLNIQSAAVVVLCEPQLKPSTEAQAIARVHRMGQIHRVEVHRLCAADSIDERIIALLVDKQRAFDDFAAHSALAAASSDATNPSRDALARQLIAAEQARLGI